MRLGAAVLVVEVRQIALGFDRASHDANDVAGDNDCQNGNGSDIHIAPPGLHGWSSPVLYRLGRAANVLAI